MKLDKDKVSIITPVYNCEEYLEQTINSVLNQTYKNWELILIDDGSKDSSKNIMEKFSKQDNRIKCIYSPKNQGVAESRNKGIEYSSGKYIAFLDSDDLWHEKKLEIQISFMKRKEIAVSFTGYEFINEKDEKLGKEVRVPFKVSYSQLLKHNCIGCLTVVLDKELIGEFKMVNIKHEDYITWLNILKNGFNAYGINDTLAYYRKRKGSVSENKIKSAQWHWNIIRNNQKLPLIKSIIYFINYTIINIKKHII